MRKPFLLVALFLMLPLSAIAQIENGFFPEFNEKDQARLRVMLPPSLQVMFEGGDRSGFFLVTLASPMAEQIFPGFKEEFGATTEQISQFLRVVLPLDEQPEEHQALFAKVMKSIDEDTNYIPTEDDVITLEAMHRYGFELANTAAAEAFNEEQMRRLDNMVFALTGGLQSLFLSEKHMDALEMTDEQKAQFKKINEETKPERDKMIASFDADLQKMIKTGKMSVKDFFSAMSKFQGLGATLKKRRSEVLTPAQIAKAKEMARLPKSMTFSVFDVLPKWAPGPNSWKPGDPIPVEVKPMPPGKFPRVMERQE